MKPFSNRFSGGLPKGKASDSKDTVLSPPSPSSSQKENFLRMLRMLPLKELPPPIEQPQMLTPLSNPSPKSEFEILSLFLSPIGDTAEYITTSVNHSRVPLSDFAAEESTDIAVAFDIALITSIM
jgi:hypothetical protein